LPLTTTQKLNHAKNRRKMLCDKKEVLSEILLKFTLKLSKTINTLDKQIILAEKEIQKLNNN